MGARVLVIEDNPNNLDLFTYLLGFFGHLVGVARTGEAGLLSAEEAPPDLIVCDVQLPGMSGFDIARRLKFDPALRSIPLVAVTALATVGQRSMVMNAGFDGYIAKPIDPEKFVEQIEGFLPANIRSAPIASRGSADDGEPRTEDSSTPSLHLRPSIPAAVH
jgi:two-component system, cell cycle response regulator